MIEEAIYSLLINASTVTDLVGSRIYPLVREQQDGLPAVTYQVISGVRGHDLGGPNGLVEGRVQVNCFAETQLAAARLAAVVRVILAGFRGGSAGVSIECVLLEDEGDLPYFEPEDEAMNVYAKTQDFFVLYKE